MKNQVKRCKGGLLHLVKIPKQKAFSVEKQVIKVLEKGKGILNYKKSIEIVIFSSLKEFVIPEIGIVGHALSQGDIVINIDFSRKDIKNIIDKWLPSAIYHELSHVVRENTAGGCYDTLLDALITEGIACYAEKEICGMNLPYIKPIKREKEFWKKAKTKLCRKKYNYNEWFFGSKKLPRWIGYRLGYLIVSSFMQENRNISLAKLVRTKSKIILKRSDIKW